MSLPTRKIGDVDVSAIGFGAMVIAGAYGTISEEEQFEVLDAAYAAGCTMWDTADRYGDSEVSIGKWFNRTGKRSEIFLGTKVGTTIEDGKPAVNGKPEYIRGAVEKCLNRLQHSVGAMAQLVIEGKVKFLGLSEVSASTLRRAYAVHPIAAVQVEYSPFTLDIEDPAIGVLEEARKLGVAIVAYSPLGRGLLTGRYRSPADFGEKNHRRLIPRFSAENFPNITKIVDGLGEIGRENYNGASSSKIALAWLLAQGPDVVPIPGTKNLKYLAENLSAATLPLAPEDVRAIRELVVAADAGKGERYPPGGFSQMMYVETPALQI